MCIPRVIDAPKQDSRCLKRKEPTGGDYGASSSRRKRRVIRTGESSSEPAGGYESHTVGEESAPHTIVEEDAAKSPPPK